MSTDHETTEPFRPTKRLYVAFGGLLAMTLMVALDSTTVSVALPTFAKELHGSANDTFWIGTAYLICSTVFQPVYGTLSFILGRKFSIYIALFFFAIGAVLAGVATTIPMMLAGRSLQGVGGAGLIALTEIVLADLIPLRYRGTYTGVLASMYALGGGVGPVVGGLFAQSNWRWIVSIDRHIPHQSARR